MTIEEMKKIADARTKGEWNYNGKFRVSIPGEEGDYFFRTEKASAAFIAMAANNWDKLMAVVDAAKGLKMIFGWSKIRGETVDIDRKAAEILFHALQALEVKSGS